MKILEFILQPLEFTGCARILEVLLWARRPMEDYCAAMRAAGVRVDPRLDVRFSDAAGYHVVTRADIEAGALLAATPLSISLDLSPDGPGAVELAGLSLPPLCVSALLLQRELIVGGGALPPAHGALLRGLRTPRNVLSFGPEHEEALRATTLQGTTMHLRERYLSLVEPFLASAPPASHFSSAALRADGLEGFVRAGALVMSRCFHADGAENASAPSALAGVIEAAGSAAAAAGDATDVPASSAASSGPILSPFLDLFNHSTHRAATHNARVGEEFRLYALRPLAAGDEVFLSYGQLGDGQLLHTYGFLPPATEAVGDVDAVRQVRNPHNAVLLPSAGVVAAVREALRAAGELDASRSKVVSAAATLLRRSGLLGDSGFVIGDCCDVDAAAEPWRYLSACLPRSLLTCIQVLILDAPSFVSYKLSSGGDALLLPAPQSAATLRRSSTGAGEMTHAADATDSPPPVKDGSVSSGDDSADSEGGSDDGAADCDDAAATWAAVLAVLRHKRAAYPSPLVRESESSIGRVKRARLETSAGLPGTAPTDPSSGGDAAATISSATPAAESAADPLVQDCWQLAIRERELLDRLVVAAVSAEVCCRSIQYSRLLLIQIAFSPWGCADERAAVSATRLLSGCVRMRSRSRPERELY